MKIAVPLSDGTVSRHFGHCEMFAIVDADTETKQINSISMQEPPVHQPGVLPQWLAETGAEIILAGGMGQRAQSLFTNYGIQVKCGVAQLGPKEAVEKFLDDELVFGENICDH